MKKSLLALAVFGAFAGAVSAQSSVTLYGRVDAGVGRSDPQEGRTSDQSATTGIFSGVLGGNRFGIRGSESLGGSMRAIYTLEAGFALDDGTSLQGGRLFGRQAYAGVAGSGGSLVLGRLASFSSGTGDFDRFGTLDPFRTGVGNFGFQATMSSANALRLDNSIAYLTPNLAGFSAGVGYTFRAAGQELAGSSGNNNAGYISYLNYSNGPLYAVVTYDSFKLGEVATDPKQNHLQMGIAWDFKVVRLSAAYAIEDGQFGFGPAGVTFTPGTVAVQQANSDADSWAIGAVVPLGAHRLAASYQSRDVDGATAAGNADRTVWALGYEYSFSRRTTGYVYYGNLSDDGAYKTGNWGGVTQYLVGMSHAF
jgi:general bacterial porin, GBP family